MTLSLIVGMTLYMACAYRYRGGWRLGTRFDSPRWLELLAVSWPMALVAFMAGDAYRFIAIVLDLAGDPVLSFGGSVGWVLAPLVLLLTMGAHSLGHGNAMNLGRRPYTGIEDTEVWDGVAGRLAVGTGYGARWRRDAIALALSGIAVGFPVALALGLMGRPWSAAIWILAGAGKLLAYEIGWRLHREGSHWRQGTELGEAGFGAILGAAVAVTL